MVKQKMHLGRASLICAAAIILVGASVAGIAIAQNRSGPVQVTANEIDVQPQNNLAIFSGNAEVVQDGFVMRSARFRVTYTQGGSIERAVSDSEIFFTSPSERVRGNRGEYNAGNNTITFYGNVVLTQGQNVVTGDELRINTITRATLMKSNSGRVKGVFFPSNSH